MKTRKIIFHYHLFKNAGTSLDEVFKKNYAGAWVTREFPVQKAQNREETDNWVVEEENALVFSSHTSQLPAPQIQNIYSIPVVFVRHPVDRIASAYNFERKQMSNSFGSVLARNTSLSGYIETRLSLQQDRQCRNFHVQRLAAMFNESQGTELERAKNAIDTIDCLGIVDRFDDSLDWLSHVFSEEGIEFQPYNAHLNASTTARRNVEDKVEDILGSLTPSVRNQLLEANKNDLEIYNYAVEVFSQRLEGIAK